MKLQMDLRVRQRPRRYQAQASLTWLFQRFPSITNKLDKKDPPGGATATPQPTP